MYVFLVNSSCVNLAPCWHHAVLQRAEKESCHTPPPPPSPFSLHSFPFLLFTCYIFVPRTTHQSLTQVLLFFFRFPLLDRRGLFTQQNATGTILHFSVMNLKMFKTLNPVASDWASGLICIIWFSQPWNSFDLRLSLMWRSETVSLSSPHPRPIMSSSFNHHTQYFPVLNVRHLFPWDPHLSIAHTVVIFFRRLQFSFQRSFCFCTRLICGGVSRRHQLSWFYIPCLAFTYLTSWRIELIYLLDAKGI